MYAALLIPALAGVMAAFLVNYLADELPRTRTLSHPVCRHCGQPYNWLNYLSLRACTRCAEPRGLRVWLVTLGMVLASFFAWLQPQRMGFVLSLLLLTYFAIVIVIDVEHRLILEPTSLFGGILALALGWWLHGLVPTLKGGLGGFAIMSAFYYLGMIFTRIRARRLRAAGAPGDSEEALGGGDVTLAAILGLLLGWPLIWFGLLLGVLIGGFIGLLIVLVEFARGRYGNRALNVFMPYAPSFVLSTFLIMFLPTVTRGLLPG